MPARSDGAGQEGWGGASMSSTSMCLTKICVSDESTKFVNITITILPKYDLRTP